MIFIFAVYILWAVTEGLSHGNGQKLSPYVVINPAAKRDDYLIILSESLAVYCSAHLVIVYAPILARL